MDYNKWKWNIAQKCELQWWKSYLKNRDVNEYLTWKKDYWSHFTNIISEVVPLKKDARYLDIGCGPAGIYLNLSDHQITCIDPLINEYNEKLKHFSKSSYPKADFINTSIEDFETSDKYDVVFYLNGINHCRDIHKSVQKIAELLRPNGYLIMSYDHHKYTWLKHLFNSIPVIDILHPYQKNLQEYQNLVLSKSSYFSNPKLLKNHLVKESLLFNYSLNIFHSAN